MTLYYAFRIKKLCDKLHNSKIGRLGGVSLPLKTKIIVQEIIHIIEVAL